jgi:hypothetical protein
VATTGIVAILLAVFLACALIFYFVRFPPRGKTLEKCRLSEKFHGLIRFGENESFLALKSLQTGDFVSFTKCVPDNSQHWYFEVSLLGPHVSSKVIDEIRPRLAIITSELRINGTVNHEGDLVYFSLAGTGLMDHNALEGFARLLLKALGHGDFSKCRVTSEGPTNWEAVKEYYQLKQKK